MVDDRLVAPECGADDPAADLELACDPVDHVVRDRALAAVPLRPAREHRAEAQRVVERRHAFDRAIEQQRAQRVDDRTEIVLLPGADPEGHVRLWLRHQPHAHLRDDPVVRLHEQLIGRRPEAALVEVPRLVVGHRAHARTQHVAVGEHDLHAALRGHVLAVGEVGHAVVERVADHAAPAEVGNREPQLVAAGPDRVVEVEPAHARLDHRVRAPLVDLEHAVHVAQAHDHRAAHARSRPAVAVVSPLAVRPERHPVLVGDAQHLLDLLHARRHHDGRGGVLVPGRVRERITELGEVCGRRQHPRRPERGGEPVECGRECLVRRRGRERRAHAADHLTISAPQRAGHRRSVPGPIARVTCRSCPEGAWSGRSGCCCRPAGRRCAGAD